MPAGRRWKPARRQLEYGAAGLVLVAVAAGWVHVELRLQEAEQQVRVLEARPSVRDLEGNLRQEIEGLSARVARLEAESPVMATRSEVDSLTAMLRREMAGIETRLSLTEPSGGGVSGTLVRRLAALETRIGEGDGAVLALLQAWTTDRLVQSVHGGLPYASEYGSVEHLLSGEPEVRSALAVLEVHAAEGVPTPAQLADSFREVWWETSLRDRSTVERLLDRLGGVVQIRRTLPSEGATPDEQLARVATLIADGDLERAVETVGQLGFLEDGPLRSWRKRAEASAEARKASRELAAWGFGRLQTLAESAP